MVCRVTNHSKKLVKLCMLEYVRAYIKLMAAKNQQPLPEELRKSELYKPNGKPHFLASIILYTCDIHLY